MASKNQVTLTFAGDSKNLEKTFDNVGGSAKKMGRETEDGFNRVGEAADTMDTRAMGFRDTMTGVEDTTRGFSEIAKGNLFDGVLLLGMGFGDLASGVANFGVQFAKTAANFIATQAKMVLTHMANAARMAAGWLIAMGPIGIVIAAIAGIIAILAALGVDFGDVQRIAGAAWHGIQGAASSVFNWLKRNWPMVLAILTGPFGLAVLAIGKHKDKILGFFTSMPGKIAGVFSDIGGMAGRAFKSAWNNTIGGRGIHIPSVGVGPFRTPGLDLTIPRMHTGGIVPGAPGQEMLTLLQAGERVSAAGASGGGPVIHVHVAGSIISERDLVKVVRDAVDRGGFGR